MDDDKIKLEKIVLPETIARDILDRVPPELAIEHKLVPIKYEDSILTVAMGDPLDIYTIDNLRFVVNCQIDCVWADPQAIEAAIDKYYINRSSVEEVFAHGAEQTFTWGWCETCGSAYVKCPRCGNNCCNAGYGTITNDDGSKATCRICALAYQYQDLAFKANQAPKKEECSHSCGASHRMTAHREKRPRLLAWLIEHNSHGLSYELRLLPEGEKPERGEFIRASWLDETTDIA